MANKKHKHTKRSIKNSRSGKYKKYKTGFSAEAYTPQPPPVVTKALSSAGRAVA